MKPKHLSFSNFQKKKERKEKKKGNDVTILKIRKMNLKIDTSFTVYHI